MLPTSYLAKLLQIAVFGFITIQTALALPSDPSAPLNIAELDRTHSFISGYQVKTDTDKVINVRFYSYTKIGRHSKRDQTQAPVSTKHTLTRLDMTPAHCTSRNCYDGRYAGLISEDCDAIIYAQLYKSNGSLTAAPGLFVVVQSNTCGVLFQNINPSSPWSLDYNFASLGAVAQRLTNKCLIGNDEPIGGVCKLDHYLEFKFQNVSISMKRVINGYPVD